MAKKDQVKKEEAPKKKAWPVASAKILRDKEEAEELGALWAKVMPDGKLALSGKLEDGSALFIIFDNGYSSRKSQEEVEPEAE